MFGYPSGCCPIADAIYNVRWHLDVGDVVFWRRSFSVKFVISPSVIFLLKPVSDLVGEKTVHLQSGPPR